MAESEKKSVTKSTPAPSAPVLGRASESSDPAVHQLLAERQTATLNDDADAAADVDRRLAELGFA